MAFHDSLLKGVIEDESVPRNDKGALKVLGTMIDVIRRDCRAVNDRDSPVQLFSDRACQFMAFAGPRRFRSRTSKHP
jgi:hypothetical protein